MSSTLPSGSFPQPFRAFHCGEGTGLQIQGRHRTQQKQYVQRHSGMFYVVCQASLSGTEPGPPTCRCRVYYFAWAFQCGSQCLHLASLGSTATPGVGESSQPQTGHQKEELSCRPCLPWGRHNLCAWFHRVSGVPHWGRGGLGSPGCRANRGVTD